MTKNITKMKQAHKISKTKSKKARWIVVGIMITIVLVLALLPKLIIILIRPDEDSQPVAYGQVSYEMETERKFLLDAELLTFSEVENSNYYAIDQSYLSFGEFILPEIRLRKIDRPAASSRFAYTMTIKSSSGDGLLSRNETDIIINESIYNFLLKFIRGQTIHKVRKEFAEGDGLLWEVDFYHGHLEGLMTMEVEFSSVEAADAYEMPEFVAADVTEDKNYKNALLAKNGIPANWQELITQSQLERQNDETI
jgi:CYTH domain-containing protein